MNGDVRLVSHNPTVMPRRNVKHVPGFHLDHPAVIHRRRRAPGEHHADVFHRTALRACRAAHVHRPFPSRLVRRTANGHSAEPHQFESALLKRANFVGLLKAFQDHVKHGLLLPLRLLEKNRCGCVTSNLEEPPLFTDQSALQIRAPAQRPFSRPAVRQH